MRPSDSLDSFASSLTKYFPTFNENHEKVVRTQYKYYREHGIHKACHSRKYLPTLSSEQNLQSTMKITLKFQLHK